MTTIYIPTNRGKPQPLFYQANRSNYSSINRVNNSCLYFTGKDDRFIEILQIFLNNRIRAPTHIYVSKLDDNKIQWNPNDESLDLSSFATYEKFLDFSDGSITGSPNTIIEFALKQKYHSVIEGLVSMKVDFGSNLGSALDLILDSSSNPRLVMAKILE